MKRIFAAIGCLALLALLCFALPAPAQSTAGSKYNPPFKYDASKEVTLKGSVSSVLAKGDPGMIVGAHLLVATNSGAVDASLGRFAMLGKDALVVEPGQQVEVTGEMRLLHNNQVLIARLVRVGDQVFTVRTESGVAISPQSRARLAQQATEKGVQP